MQEARKQLVVVGGGMAAGRLLEEFARRLPHRFDITVVGDEIQGSYNRIMLSAVLADEVTAEAIIGKPAKWFSDHGIRFLGGRKVSQIDRQNRTLVMDNGDGLHYDELVLATGSRPAVIPAQNQGLQNIYSFRTLGDVEQIAAAARVVVQSGPSQKTARAVVVGGGLLGLEAAYGLAKKGLPVTVVHRSGWLLNRQLDPAAGELLRQVLAARNINFELANEVEAFLGDDVLSGVRLKNGKTLCCQLAVIATGIRPNKELGLAAGLAGARGVFIDDYMCTSDPAISAIGECAEYRGETFGLVDPIWQHCVSLADRLCLNRLTPFSCQPVATKLKVSGIQLFSAGIHLAGEEHRELILQDAAAGVYRKLILKEGRIQGVVLFGDTRDGPDYFTMMQDRVDVSACVSTLLLGKAFYGELAQAQAA